ncbi:Dipeptidyl aminopeptidase BI (DAP BI) [Durusdinium trenchii]|uniref:Dipeptidyl aminopeptidase BI (DAP BI) n=1 Tax=Durusdinium trenchii TaxID=1381693 RepID=A0ABP0N0K5_9DINO
MASFGESDEEEEEEEDIHMGDESYRGPPVRGFDDSQGPGITSFKAKTNLGPTDFGFLLGQVQEASSVPVPPSPLSDGSDAGGYGDSSGMLKRCRSRGDQEMLVDAKRLAVEGLQPPIVALRPQQVLSGFVEGEDRGSNLMDPPVVRTDPFSWLRDDTHQNEEIQQLLEDEDTYCTRALSGLQELSDTLLREMRSHEKDSSVGIPSIYPGGYAYYSRGTKKRSYQSHFRARVVADATDSATRGQPVPADVAVLAEVINLKLADEELLLDENDLNDDGEGGSRPYLSVCGPDPSADHLFYAYAKDFEGNDSYQISFHHIGGSGTEMDLVELEETDGSILWESSGHAAIYYVGHDHEYRGYIVRRHVLGTPQASDVVVLEETDKRFSVNISKTSDERFLVIQSASSETAESYMLDLQSGDQARLLSVCPRDFGIHYEIDHCNGRFGRRRRSEDGIRSCAGHHCHSECKMGGADLYNHVYCRPMVSQN